MRERAEEKKKAALERGLLELSRHLRCRDQKTTSAVRLMRALPVSESAWLRQA
jgi:hypothetical protein